MNSCGSQIDSAPVSLSNSIDTCHNCAVAHGWWEQTPERSFPEQIALMHSELSEALEYYREYGLRQTTVGILPHIIEEPGYLFYQTPDGDSVATLQCHYDEDDERNGKLNKPEGIAAELADTLIRIFDTCGKYEIPLAQALFEKMAYNETRPYRHGGKLA